MKPYFVYLLTSTTKNRTYVGCTCDLVRRLRQHNGEISGGAKYTKYGRPWKMICYVAGFPDKRTAYQFEWRMHHPPRYLRRRGYGVKGRMECMDGVLKLDKFTKSCVPTSELNLDVVHLIGE